MTLVRVLFDEHLGRDFEQVLRERGYEVDKAEVRFAERMTDWELLRWCDQSEAVLVTNNAKDFEPLHPDIGHASLFLFYDQRLPDADPEGLARTVDEVLTQCGTGGVRIEMAALDEWYAWLQ